MMEMHLLWISAVTGYSPYPDFNIIVSISLLYFIIF